MDVNEEVTILCAVRYAMGRMSYAPGAVIDHILSRIEDIGETQASQFVGNIEKDIQEREMASTYDFAYQKEWKSLVKQIKEHYKL